MGQMANMVFSISAGSSVRANILHRLAIVGYLAFSALQYFWAVADFVLEAPYAPLVTPRS
jgi:hypothetical protein